jgi:hypothetical protein
MKKIIKILQSNVEPTIIIDEDDSDLSEYVQSLSNILSAGNVTILETSGSTHILRPQKIISMVVTEEGRPKPKRKYTKKKKVEIPKVEKPKEDIQEDIITDG